MYDPDCGLGFEAIDEEGADGAADFTASENRCVKFAGRLMVAACCALLAALVFCAAFVKADTPTTPTMPTTPTTPKFIVGVFQQPCDPATLARWSARGVKLIVNPVYGPDQYAKNAMQAAALCQAAGFTTAGGDDAFAMRNQLDEPDGKGVSPDSIVNTFNTWSGIDSRAILLNVDASRFPNATGDPTYPTSEAYYTRMFAGADWVSSDDYTDGKGFHGTDNYDRIIGTQLFYLKRWAPTKKHLIYLGSGNQHLENSPVGKQWAAQGRVMRGCTGAEFKQQVGIAAADGADGILIFSHDAYGMVDAQGIAGWAGFDDTPDDVSAAMAALWAGAIPPPPAVPPVVPVMPATPTSPAVQPALRVDKVTVNGVDYFPR